MIEQLQRIWKHRHSTSLIVAALAAVGMWYLGDTGLTGMPPRWVIVSGAFAVGGICTAAVQEARERGWMSSAQPEATE